MNVEVQMTTRRCPDCHRWFATEVMTEWVCGSCARDRIDRECARNAKLRRTIAALRGALKRRGAKRRRA